MEASVLSGAGNTGNFIGHLLHDMRTTRRNVKPGRDRCFTLESDVTLAANRQEDKSLPSLVSNKTHLMVSYN